MSEQRIFQLEAELEELKRKRNRGVIRITPIFPALVMAAGVILSAIGQSSIGYPLGVIGFLGMLITIFGKNILETNTQRIENRIIAATRELEELRRE